jgi:hypothetical protein
MLPKPPLKTKGKMPFSFNGLTLAASGGYGNKNAGTMSRAVRNGNF